MATFWAMREGMTLRPWGAESASIVGKVAFGKPVEVQIKQPRNAKFSALFWVLCTRIGDAVGCDSEDIAFILKKRTGHYKEVKTKHGVEEIPLSISFARMDELAFREFFSRCIHVIETEFGIVRPDVLAAVSDILESAA
jgi:hypothetical protein